MKAIKFTPQLVALAVTACFLISLLAPLVKPGRSESAELFLSDKAVQFLCNEYVDNGIINSDVGVGSYALFVLIQAGVDVSTWAHEGVSLKDAVIATVTDDIANADKVSAKCLAQDLAVVKALGQNALTDRLVIILKNKQGSQGFEDTGPFSIYSNMPAFDLLSRVGRINQLNAVQAKDYILEQQYLKVKDVHYGSWGSSENDQYYADFMATAGAIRTLNGLDPEKSDAQIQEAINNGLGWMKNQQKAGGNFMAGMDDTLIDTCEVIITLKALGMDPGTWQSSEGNSAVDYIINNALNPDGSFGAAQNAMDATWVLWTCLALNGKIDTQPPAQPDLQVRPDPEIFNDIPDHWAENTIYCLAGKGIISGYPDGAFKPEAQVTRNEIAAMTVRLLKPEPATTQEWQITGEKFTDAADIPQWAQESIAAALREGIISGYPQPDGSFTFEGARQVSRAELSVIMTRIIEKKLGQAAPKTLDFADVAQLPEWARGAIGIVYAKGIAGGYPDRTFQAENPVTRAEAASMMMLLADLLETK
ncbi:Cellulosome-anchoring protein precursor [Pelotomaculum sp. FP]|uniref:S-layer homology domain-containing protein n=1 Tax=Pelotomaculum sp. FP TaxID=261474 RepID=UPI001065BA64|nr:S-layer homology domain-containing protein [Pelotomaculum sp. FP]TEB16731.1 Cellulosome-anchoring protein precursor [Pelotomaculum sp. FP]